MRQKNVRFHDPPEKMYLLTAVMLIEATQYARIDALELLIRPPEAGPEGGLLLTVMASSPGANRLLAVLLKRRCCLTLVDYEYPDQQPSDWEKE